jgi:hypothetical protein
VLNKKINKPNIILLESDLKQTFDVHLPVQNHILYPCPLHRDDFLVYSRKEIFTSETYSNRHIFSSQIVNSFLEY